MGHFTSYVFSACQVNLESREVLLAGQRQPVAPRVFELLLHLIEHHDRVVSKDELLDRIWRGTEVSESVIARTVMKARQAIGDTGREPALIKTVHRVGYRFVGELARSATVATAQGEGAGPCRVGLMPFRNATGRADLDWVALGLAALVAQALEGDRRLAVTGPGAVAAALASLPPDLPAVQRDATAAALLGTPWLVHAVLRANGDRLRLDYRTQGEKGLRGSLQGSDPIELGHRLAHALEAGLFPKDQWPVAFVAAHPLARLAFAQALEMEQRKDWPAAAELLRSVLQREPGSLPARLQYLRVLANLRDPAAIALGEALLPAAQAGTDTRLLAMVHEALARAHFNAGGEAGAVEAARHLDTALRLAAPYKDEDWVVRVHLGMAIQCQTARDPERARRFYALAQRGTERSGGVMRLATILNNRSAVEMQCGNPLGARELAAEALALCRTHHMHANAANALLNLTLVDAGLGLFRRALHHCEQAVGLMPLLPAYEFDTPAWVAVIAGDLALGSRQVGPLDAALQCLAAREEAAPPRVRALIAFAGAYPALRAGQVAGAVQAMQQALAAVRTQGFDLYAHALALPLLWALLRHGLDGPAQALADEVATWPSAAADDDLQAGLLYRQAAQARRAAPEAGAPGPAQQALALLTRCLQLAPLGRWQGRARLDAAWLLTEQGDTAAAARMLRDAGPWVDEHPIGLATVSRLQWARGQHQDAADTLQAGLDLIDGPLPPFLLALLQAYRAGGAGLPQAPCLAGLL